MSALRLGTTRNTKELDQARDALVKLRFTLNIAKGHPVTPSDISEPPSEYICELADFRAKKTKRKQT